MAMTSQISFRPELRPITDSAIVPIKIKNPRGGLITIAELDPAKTTIGDLKKQLHKRNRKFTVERQRYTYKPEDSRHQIILKDRFTLASYKVGAGDTIVFRDLGVHYPWKTEYLMETALLVSSYLLFYAFHESHRPTPTTYLFQKILLACWILPHALSVVETIGLPFSNRVAPFALTLKVALPHSLLGMITSYFLNGPEFEFTLSHLDMSMVSVCIGIFVCCHILRFLLHMYRRKSIPYDFTIEHAILDVIAWSVFFIMVRLWVVGAVFIGCTLWRHYIYWRIRSDNA